MKGFIASLRMPNLHVGLWIWLARVGMFAAGICVAAYSFSVIKETAKKKGSKFFPRLIRIALWLAVVVGANICVYRLLNAYTLFFFLGCIVALISTLFSK